MQERRAKDYTKKGKKLDDCGACLKTDFKMVSYIKFLMSASSVTKLFFLKKNPLESWLTLLKNIKLTLVLGLLAVGFKYERSKNRRFRLG